MELTGKRTWRAIKYTANIVQIAFKYVWALLLWIGGLLAAILLRIAISAWRLFRFAVRRVRKRRTRRRSIPTRHGEVLAQRASNHAHRLNRAPSPRLTVS